MILFGLLTNFRLGEFDGLSRRKVRILPHELIRLCGICEVLINDHSLNEVFVFFLPGLKVLPLQHQHLDNLLSMLGHAKLHSSRHRLNRGILFAGELLDLIRDGHCLFALTFLLLLFVRGVDSNHAHGG